MASCMVMQPGPGYVNEEPQQPLLSSNTQRTPQRQPGQSSSQPSPPPQPQDPRRQPAQHRVPDSTPLRGVGKGGHGKGGPHSADGGGKGGPHGHDGSQGASGMTMQLVRTSEHQVCSAEEDLRRCYPLDDVLVRDPLDPHPRTAVHTHSVVVYDPCNRLGYLLNINEVLYNTGKELLWRATFNGETQDNVHKSMERKRFFLCMLFQDNRCKGYQRCNNIHLDRARVAQFRQKYQSKARNKQMQHDMTVSCIPVPDVDDPSRSLDIRIGSTLDTAGRVRGMRGLPVVLCPVNISGGVCEMGLMCRDVHLRDDVIRAFRVACCVSCNQPTQEDRTFLRHISNLRMRVKLKNDLMHIDPAHLGITDGLKVLCREHPNVLEFEFPRGKFCHRHLNRECKYGYHCNNIHVCRKQFPRYFVGTRMGHQGGSESSWTGGINVRDSDQQQGWSRSDRDANASDAAYDDDYCVPATGGGGGGGKGRGGGHWVGQSDHWQQHQQQHHHQPPQQPVTQKGWTQGPKGYRREGAPYDSVLPVARPLEGDVDAPALGRHPTGSANRSTNEADGAASMPSLHFGQQKKEAYPQQDAVPKGATWTGPPPHQGNASPPKPVSPAAAPQAPAPAPAAHPAAAASAMVPLVPSQQVQSTQPTAMMAPAMQAGAVSTMLPVTATMAGPMLQVPPGFVAAGIAGIPSIPAVVLVPSGQLPANGQTAAPQALLVPQHQAAQNIALIGLQTTTDEADAALPYWDPSKQTVLSTNSTKAGTQAEVPPDLLNMPDNPSEAEKTAEEPPPSVDAFGGFGGFGGAGVTQTSVSVAGGGVVSGGLWTG